MSTTGTDMTSRHRRVVVGVDGSDPALAAVRWAATQARRRQSAVRLVAAYTWAPQLLPALAGEDLERAAAQVRAAVEADLTAAAAAAGPGPTIERSALVGPPVDVLVAQSDEADLVVLGDRGRGRFLSMIAGSVAVGTAVHARCPVVVVRGEDVAAEAPVVVGIDGTPVSERAIAFAFAEADARQVPLIAVHTWADALEGSYLQAVVERAPLIAEETELLAQRLAGWAQRYPDVEVRRVVIEGRAAQVLLDLSKDAQLVVTGSRGHGQLTGALLGSVSNALLHGAHCPVAVVRSG